MKRSHVVFLVVFVVLLIDQVTKIWVKTNMHLHEHFNMFGDAEWAQVFFIENPGMAFGLELGGDYGKLALSLFRVVAVVLLSVFIYRLTKEKASKGLLVCFALVLAGALGNIIDSAFYGLIFSDSNYQVAQFMPDGGGYAGFLHGKVVDMLYFPMYEGYFPEWVPYRGGTKFEFFKPVFNIADSSITIGIISLLLFQRSFFKNLDEQKEGTADKVEDTIEEASREAETTVSTETEGMESEA